MRNDIDGSWILEHHGEAYAARKALIKSNDANNAPNTLAKAAEVTSLHLENAEDGFNEVTVPVEEVDVLINSLRNRSLRKISVVGAQARIMLEEYERLSQQSADLNDPESEDWDPEDDDDDQEEYFDDSDLDYSDTEVETDEPRRHNRRYLRDNQLDDFDS